jgi:CheY-like chemotaxis protein
VRKDISNIKVLIVDDNFVNRRVLNYALLKYKIKTDEAENGLIALEKYKNTNYDLILMDIMMPEMDGLEATSKIRDYEKTTGISPAIIIAISANFQDEDRDEYMSHGLNEIFKKPVDFKELDKYLRQYFEIK